MESVGSHHPHFRHAKPILETPNPDHALHPPDLSSQRHLPRHHQHPRRNAHTPARKRLHHHPTIFPPLQQLPPHGHPDQRRHTHDEKQHPTPDAHLPNTTDLRDKHGRKRNISACEKAIEDRKDDAGGVRMVGARQPEC